MPQNIITHMLHLAGRAHDIGISVVETWCITIDKGPLAAVPLSLCLDAQRQFNTAHLLAHYMGDKALSGDAIAWNRNDPNILSIRLPGGSLLHEHGAWFRCGACFEPLPEQEATHVFPCTHRLAVCTRPPLNIGAALYECRCAGMCTNPCP